MMMLWTTLGTLLGDILLSVACVASCGPWPVWLMFAPVFFCRFPLFSSFLWWKETIHKSIQPILISHLLSAINPL